jgi:F0F1-type ATP synthase membrane subunit c/vacuolar-type H+-ATPase subunit K
MNGSSGLATGLVIGMTMSNSQNRDIRSEYEKMCIDKQSTKISDGVLTASYRNELIDTCKNNEIIASNTGESLTGLGVFVAIVVTVIVVLGLFIGLLKLLDY